MCARKADIRPERRDAGSARCPKQGLGCRQNGKRAILALQAFPDIHPEMDDQPINRTCAGCRISKVKCDLQPDDARCSRCTRLNLDCVREIRGNLSTGASRLKAQGICALKLQDSSTVRGNRHQPTAVIEMLTRMAFAAGGPHGAYAVRLLHRCGQAAWHHNDTRLMAWVLDQAATRGLPLRDFAPASLSSLTFQLEPSGIGVPPPFIREILGTSDTFAIAFVQHDTVGGTWITNDNFDTRVCSRSTLLEARSQSPCAVSALFTPTEEIEPFERRIYSPLFAACFAAAAPADGRGIRASAANACEGGEEADEETPETEAVVAALQSEIVDSTSMWRLRLLSQEAVCCKVVFRCAVLRDGAELWMAGCYYPQEQSDGSWMTSKPADAHRTSTQNRMPSQRQRRKRRAESDVPEPADLLSPDGADVQLHADALFQQLEVTSTEEMLRLLDDEPAGGLS